MELFDKRINELKFENSGLANRMRPLCLDDIAGHQDILGEEGILRSLIESDTLSSLVFYGPPGCGKTALASVIALTTKSIFVKLNAVTSNLKELREVIARAKEDLFNGRKTIVFIDEIHRFNKAQQDVLLPEIEEGTFSLIGTTTLNPYFAINSALLSRSSIFEMSKLSVDDMVVLLKRALNDTERGLGKLKLKAEDDVLKEIAKVADGDARYALNSLETASSVCLHASKDSIDLSMVAKVMQKKGFGYDRDGTAHYDTISAFIKSMRGGDPDAVLYWLAKMLHGGEDIRFIARRIIICASEDVGNADPKAIGIAMDCANACDYVGMPEARIILAQAAVYIACAPKSNASYMGINKALEYVKNNPIQEIPRYLKDTPVDAVNTEKGEPYKYPHDYQFNHVKQKYMPEDITFYTPGSLGYEKIMAERLKIFKGEKPKTDSTDKKDN